MRPELARNTLTYRRAFLSQSFENSGMEVRRATRPKPKKAHFQSPQQAQRRDYHEQEKKITL